MITLTIKGKSKKFDDAYRVLCILKRYIYVEHIAPWEWSVVCDDSEDLRYIMENL